MTALPRSGDAFAGHLIEDEIGRGGMGVVFRATNRELRRERAIKVIAPEHSANPTYAARFQRESRLAAAVEHPNVVPIHAAGEDRDLLFIVMRLVEGPDLDRLLRGGPLPPERAIGILRQIAGALDAAHDAGLVHRDIKPGNVLIEDRRGEDHVYLTDFGVSKRSAELIEAERETGLTIDGQVVGTAAYLAPEQIEHGTSDQRADIYSLACVAFHVLTGRPPFPRDTELGTLVAHAREPRPDASAVNHDLDPAVDEVLCAGMAVDPAARQGSATELVDELAAALEGPVPTRSTGSAQSRRRRPRWIVRTLLSVLAVAAVAASFLLLDAGDDGSSPPAPEVPVEPEVATVALENGSSPVGVAVDGDTAFIASRDVAQSEGPSGLVDRVHLGRAEIKGEPVPVPSPRSLALGDGALWVASGEALYRVARDGSVPQRIVTGGKPDDVAVSGDLVWVSDEEGDSVGRLDALAANPTQQSVPVGDEPRSIAATPSAAWVAVAGEGMVARVDSETMRVEAEIPVGPRPTSVAVGGGSVWVADNAENTVRRDRPAHERGRRGADRGGAEPPRHRIRDGSIWVASGSGNVVERFDADTRARIGRPIPVGADPADVVSAGRVVVTANQAGDSVSLIGPSRSRRRRRCGGPTRLVDRRRDGSATASPACAHLFGRRQAHLILVSPGPTRGPATRWRCGGIRGPDPPG